MISVDIIIDLSNACEVTESLLDTLMVHAT